MWIDSADGVSGVGVVCDYGISAMSIYVALFLTDFYDSAYRNKGRIF